MERFIVEGGRKLYGKPQISSAKNSVLPLIAASILRNGKTIIENCPRLCDVSTMCDIIKSIGGKCFFEKNSLIIDTGGVKSWNLPCELTVKIRASFFTVGALLSRFGAASVCRPGGCDLGDRPIDIHIQAFRDLGVDVKDGEIISFKKKRNDGGKIKLKYPSVGATENLIMYAVSLKGETVIENAAREPEIIDLQNYLNLIGANVRGAGSSVITVNEGCLQNGGTVVYSPFSDRIEAGTFLFAGAICGGELSFYKTDLFNLVEPLKILSNNACKITPINDKIVSVSFNERMNGYGKIIIAPFPSFPTDLQPQLVASACYANGLTVVEERVFPKRFAYVDELTKIGADIVTRSEICVVSGKTELSGAKMSAAELRGGAALLIAALGAKGKSEILNIQHIDRGYYAVEKKLQALGASVNRVIL